MRLATAWMALLCLACNDAVEAPAVTSAPADPQVIELDAPLATAPVRRAQLRRSLRLPATVELDPTRVSRIDSGVDGRIVEVYVVRGETVDEGQPLALVTSPDFTEGQVSLVGALAEVNLQRRAVERAGELVDAEVFAQAELERRQAQLFLAATDVQSHRDKLRLMGMSPREIQQVERSESILSEVTIFSRGAGIVIERAVSREEVVSPGDSLFTVADLSRVRVEGRAPEREVDFLAEAESVRVEIPATGAGAMDGERLEVDATVDPDTRTVTVRTEIASPGSTIKPAMLATLLLVGPARELLAIPAAAVVREGSADHVFVQEAAGRYRFVPVSVDPEIEGLRAVSEGLDEGDLVVVDGAFRLNSERRRRAGG